MRRTRTVLEGSRRPIAVSRSLPQRDADARIEVTVRLRSRRRSLAAKNRLRALFKAPPNRRRYLSRSEHESIFGSRAEDIALVDAFAHKHGLTIVDCHVAKRTVRLAGRIGDIQRAFGIRLRSIRAGKMVYHAHRESVTLPSELKDAVCGVFGLDSRPVSKAHLRPPASPGSTAPAGLPPKVACQLYGFPPELDGSGQCLAIIEVNEAISPSVMGTGYAVADLNQFFAGQGLSTPSVTAVGGAGGAGNFPGPNPDGDAEVALDIEMAGAAAPGCSIAVYFGVNSEQGHHDSVAAAVHDNVRNPRVISISWGSAESDFSPGFVSGMEELLSEAGTMGITICTSTGDAGSSGKSKLAADGVSHANYPASSPSVLACGGTTATIQNGMISSETAWNDGYEGGAGGGGVSELFPCPSWQKSSSIPPSFTRKWAGRGIPDLAAHADQSTGYGVVVGGQPMVLGGTSAVAPFIAGLLTRINQARTGAGRGPVGFINPILYQNPGAFRDIVSGSNDIDSSLGVYDARTGWDACTGLGAPIGTSLLQILS